MLKKIRGILSFNAKNAKLTDDVPRDDIPRYPPFIKGLPAAAVEKIINTQSELIKKIRTSLGYNSDEFGKFVEPVIYKLASFMHLLPASESHHHRGAGGLFRHSLEVAFWSAQMSESIIFSAHASPKERRKEEPLWRLACCLAGLLHDAGKPLSDMTISDKEGNIEWDPYTESLADWLVHHQIGRYFIRWRARKHKRHEQFSLLAIEKVMPPEILKHLSSCSSGAEIIEAILEAIAGTGINQPLTKIMLRADQESVSKDLVQNRLNIDEYSYGVPVERYIFDSIRRLIRSEKWTVNQPGAKVWHFPEGTFIVWQNISELYELISKDNIPGIPRDPDTLAEILIERGFAIPNKYNDLEDKLYYRYWEVSPEILPTLKLLMLRISSAELIFTSEPPVTINAVIHTEFKKAPVEKSKKKSSKKIISDVVETPLPEVTPSSIYTSDATDQYKVDSVVSPENKPSNVITNPLDALINAGGSLGGIDSSLVSYSTAEGHDEVGMDFDNSSSNMVVTEPFNMKPDSLNELDSMLSPLLLSKYKEISPLLSSIISPILNGEQFLGDKLFVFNRSFVLRYPEGLKNIGAPASLLKELYNAGAIVSDPIFPSKKISEANGFKVVTFNSEVTKELSILLKSAYEELYQSTKQNVSKLIVNTTEATLPSPNLQLNLEHNSSLDPINQIIEIEKFSDDELSESKSNNEINMDDYLPLKMTPEKALQSLKEMILMKNGPWLISPVLEEKEGDVLFLVTSDKALDRIAGEYIDISKHMLRGLLKRGQRKPLLLIRQGKLYLQVDKQ